MKLALTRIHKSSKATIGELSIDGVKRCNTLEDVDRGLTSDMTADQIASIKVQNQTAIPTGQYEVIIDYSNHFGKYLPHILNVPVFEGIRIHSGNSDVDTDGCVLLGSWDGVADDWVSGSKDAFGEFLPKLEQGLSEGKVFIEIS